MAEVWRSEWVGPDGSARPVAIKRIRRAFIDNAEFVRMLIAEARLSARLDHSNIVTVFDFGREDGELYLVMEYIQGRDLLSTLRAGSLSGRPMPIGQSLYVAREIARALAYAHALTDERGAPLHLVHRDVSPANVLLGFDGVVKLADFGIAKILAESTDVGTTTGVRKGKAPYMAPEQLAAGRTRIDTRVDIYALGIVLHEMLSGRRLFKHRLAEDPQEPELEEEVLPPSRFNAEVSPALDALCLRALAKVATDRFANASEMASALDEMVLGSGWSSSRAAEYLRALFHGQSAADDAGEGSAEDGPTLATSPARRGPEQTANVTAATDGRRRGLTVGLGLALALGTSLTWFWATSREGARPEAGKDARPVAIQPSVATPPPITAAPPAVARFPSSSPTTPQRRMPVTSSHAAKQKRAVAPRPVEKAPPASPARTKSVVRGDVLDPFDDRHPTPRR